ncbi:MAG TPA: COX15/CtaA family protein [Acidimicrobiales bacterium]|nr:COX15/CtaA family protein [Acidimicrobiales bacterium]
MSTWLRSPRTFLVLCRASFALIILNVATGAAVRLSDSGLGCPDWPTCSHQHLTPPLSFHPVIEFGNRMVVSALVVGCGITWVASLVRRPARRDLRWLSGGLILGILGESVVGAVVVYSKLNAYVVMGHFMVGIALLSVSVVLALRAGHGPGRGVPSVSRRVLILTRAYLTVLILAIVAGTATTGAGPHAGGKGAKRVPIALSDMTRIHAELVLVTGVVLIILLWTMWRSDAPARVQQSGRILLAVMVFQGLVGYTQYFTHLPVGLVFIHVVGAVTVWSTALWFHHGLSDHRPEAVPLADRPSGQTSSDREALTAAPAGGAQ